MGTCKLRITLQLRQLQVKFMKSHVKIMEQCGESTHAPARAQHKWI